MNDRFQIVGARPLPEAAPTKNRHSLRGKPVASAMILSLIVLGCLFCELIMTKAPAYLDLAHCSAAPCREFLFGTDTMGRDIFSMIWYGGRLSLFIGVGSTVISTLLAILFGAVSGLAPRWLDALLMRLTEILLSVPNLLLVIFLQAVIGTPSAWSIALVIGLTSWTSIAKVVVYRGQAAARERVRHRGEVHGRQLFPHSAVSPCAEFLLVHPLHGGDECAQRHHRRIDAQLHGPRPAH